jgi:hypothetical protein
MESEMLRRTRATRRNIPEDAILHRVIVRKMVQRLYPDLFRVYICLTDIRIVVQTIRTRHLLCLQDKLHLHYGE